MPQYKVNVKWGKQKFSEVDLSTEEAPDVFKLQLYSLTNVLPERQKIMLKGMTVKDDWTNLKLKNGATLLLLGTAEELPKEPEVKPVFVEDMSEDQLASAMDLVTGLENLGNTCYMNSSVQLLTTVPEFEQKLMGYNGQSSSLMAGLSGSLQGDSLEDGITAGLRDLIKNMKAKDQVSIKPFMLLSLLYMRFPHFAEKNEHGAPMQQDANEFLTELLRICQQKLKPNEEPNVTSSRNVSSFIDQYFGIEYDTTMKCEDDAAKDEAPTNNTEKSLQLNCFISQEVKYMLTGIKSKLKEEITKRSPTLERDAIYCKTSEIKRLPAYLCVQMVRFFYKERSAVSAKILKDVKFPMTFDAYELCSPELQKRLKPVRDKFEAIEEAEAEAKMSGKLKQEKLNPTKNGENEENKEFERYDFPDDVGSNNSGHYELQGIITHQGRSSSSGHYVAWIRQKADTWLKCDDETVTPVTSEDVLKLSGGGDWHIAYILLYGPKRLEKTDAKKILESVAASNTETAMET